MEGKQVIARLVNARSAIGVGAWLAPGLSGRRLGPDAANTLGVAASQGEPSA